MRSTAFFPVGRTTLCAATLVLAGCALGPDFHRPAGPPGAAILPADATAPSLEADGGEQHFARAAEVPARWWRRLGSADLDALVERALRASPSLRAAQATLRQSQDSLQAGYGVFFPQVGASAMADRQSSVINLGHGLISTGPYNVATLGASVSYVPDLFGAQRRSVEALGAQVDAQRFALRAAALSLTANVVNTVIARAAYQDQLAATRDIARLLDDQLRVAQVQDAAGTAPYAAVLALQAQRAATQVSAAALDQRVDQADHLLALLCGAAPADFHAPAIALDRLALPAELPDAVPADLARQRPDILAAEAALHEASARIGVATADLFPSLTLGGTAGSSHADIGELLRAGTRYWSAQASLGAVLFAGGSQWYARQAAIDAYDAALAQYDASVLAALDQVADVMRALAHDAQALRAQADSLHAATQGARLVGVAYEAGSAAYLDVLAADAQLAQARLAYLGGRAQRLQDTVALYAALGGGWWQADARPAAADAALDAAVARDAPAAGATP